MRHRIANVMLRDLDLRFQNTNFFFERLTFRKFANRI